MPRFVFVIRACAMVLACGCFVAAQERVITVQNLTPFARREWARAVVPFPKGAVADLPAMHIGKGPTIWQPIGARWADGSLRQALCLFPIEMKGLSEVRLPLAEGKGPALPAIPITDPVRTGSAKIVLRLKSRGKAIEASPAFVGELESNAARRVSLYRCRVGETGFVFELIVNAYAGQDHAYVDFALFFSDPKLKAMEMPVESAVIATTGMHFIPLHPGPLAIETKIQGAGSDVTLLRNVVVGDGQGIRRTGALTPKLDGKGLLWDQTLQAAALGPILAATSWRGTGAYGPFGVVPLPPPWLRGNAGRQALARRHAEVVRRGRDPGHPFQRLPFGLLKDPSATGSQADFGILKMTPVVSTGMPSFLFEVEPSILQEACRPVHFFESDGSPLQSRNHPDWVQWNGGTHWNCEASKDRLGKPCPVPKFFTNGWYGKDRQHWSSNYLCGYYLLTGNHWALREIQNEVQLFLAGQTLRKGVATTGPGAPRAAGRMLLLGCWLYQCTGDESLPVRMRNRVTASYFPFWFGRDLPADRVRPFAVRGPNAGLLGGKVKFWTPWEESIAAAGFAALYRLTGDVVAGHLADGLSMNALRHGWLIDQHGAHVGYQLRFNEGGEPITDEQMLARNPDICTFAGGGISLWSLPAVVIALHYAKEREDAAMIKKAERILELMRSGRDRPPSDGWWDEYRDWDAVTLEK